MRHFYIALALSRALGAEPVDLVQNGSFADAPAPASIPMEHHANAEIWLTPRLPGWTLAGAQLVYRKVPNERVLDLTKGRASQVIPTEAGKTYRLVWDMEMSSEFMSKGVLMVSAGRTEKFNLGPGLSYRNCWLNFQAKGSSTQLTFAGAGGTGGPSIKRIHCYARDLSGYAVEQLLGPVYREMDRGEKSEKDLDKFTSVLADDFSWQPLEGQALDRTGYENLVRQRLEKKFKVNTEIIESTQKEENVCVFEVERRESQSGDYGKLESRAPHFLHTWVKVGTTWRLKSAEEVTR
ncbi:MAG: hypothetical protein KF760_04165 [Candidatus Eremiobacteraeota bacterium]|nr:hypothetical protein [Candidatus Eremiobacteraeota bacterium]MCW5867110.1 hypothetical protein [Candidatus Eremiobacteraeota bacterium]